MTCLAGHDLGNHDALFHRLVREHRATHHITDRPYAVEIGLAVIINHHETPLVDLETHGLGIETCRVGDPPDRDDELVEDRLGGTVLVLVLDSDRLLVLGRRDLADLDAQLDVHALLGKDLLGFLGDVLVGRAEEAVHRFEDGHLGTESTPHRAHFETDDARPDQAESLGYRVEIECADVVADKRVVDRHARQMTGARAGRHDDLFRLDGFIAHLHLPAAVALADKAAMAGQEGDLVLLEQELDAAGELVDHLRLAIDHGWHIDRYFALDLDALSREGVLGLFEEVGGVQQRLGRYATDVQAGAAETRLALGVGVGV